MQQSQDEKLSPKAGKLRQNEFLDLSEWFFRSVAEEFSCGALLC